jgi:polar amino acid transport system substrate-binding protein
LNGHFMVIEQAMGVPKRFGDEAAAYVNAFVEDMKTSGSLAEALARHGIKGASFAP